MNGEPRTYQLPVLVTGGTGFVGSHLIETLLTAGFSNVHTTTFGDQKSFVHDILPAQNIHKVDLTNQSAISALFVEIKPTTIYHLAAYADAGASFDQSQLVLENNLKIQLSFLEAVRQSAPKARILVVGSGMEYDFIAKKATKITEEHPLGPVSPYAVSKVIQDLLGLSFAYSYKLDVVRARPFNHIGERQTAAFAIPSFAQQIVAIENGKQKHIAVGNLDSVRDFTDVKDVVKSYILLLEKGQGGEVYNIGSGVGHSMQEMLDMLCELSTVKIEVVTDPAKVRPLDVPMVVADISKIQKLGWSPEIPIQETLRRILEEWRAKPTET